jgi:hypothetical protein
MDDPSVASSAPRQPPVAPAAQPLVPDAVSSADARAVAQTGPIVGPGAGGLNTPPPPVPVAPAPGAPSQVSLWEAAGRAEHQARATLAAFQIANRELDAKVAQISWSSSHDRLVEEARKHVGDLQRSAIADADVNLRAQQDLANAVTDPVPAAQQSEQVAAAESYVRQANNNTPIGIAETTEKDLRAAVDDCYREQTRKQRLELEVSQKKLSERIQGENDLAKPREKYDAAFDKVNAALGLNIAKWDQADTAAQAANKDGSHPEDARIAREGHLRAQAELLIWKDGEKIADRKLRAAVEAVRKANKALMTVELEVSENRLSGDGPEKVKDKFNRAMLDLSNALENHQGHWSELLTAAKVANRDGRHTDGLQKARDGLNMAKAEKLIRDDGWPL